MRWAWSVAAMLAMASPAAAQRAPLHRLSSALDSTTRMAVLAIVDSARVAHLPSDALVNKALEGAGKRATGPQIVAAVRALAGELHTAREALGRASRPEEITAGAHALHAGVTAAELTELRHVSVGRPLTTPLTVLTDLVARGVPPGTASEAMESLSRAGLRDVDFTTFQRAVRQDIDRGADPASAMLTRARGATLRRGGGGGSWRRPPSR
jgi:hypothetical protein